MNAYWMASVSVVTLPLMGVYIISSTPMCDTIKNRDVLYDLIKKVNAFIDEMKSPEVHTMLTISLIFHNFTCFSFNKDLSCCSGVG